MITSSGLSVKGFECCFVIRGRPDSIEDVTEETFDRLDPEAEEVLSVDPRVEDELASALRLDG
jgi:hypothetical protein